MATAISLESETCSDVPRWYSASLELADADVPFSLGYPCIVDLCIQRLFDEEYTVLILGMDYTADLDAGTVTLLSEMEGTLTAYFNVIVCATEEECKTAPCCPPDIYEYESINGTDSGTETNEDCEEVPVEVSPISGAFLFFPSYVVLSADHDDAVITYTTDGSDPDEFSTVYTEPFLVEQAGTIVKARATVGDCSAGPITTVLFQNPPFILGFGYGCDVPDNGGTWDVWVPNGTPDNHWQITFHTPTPIDVARFEVYQLDAFGQWTTGIMWSTDSPVPIDGVDFAAMPLLLFTAGVQQHTAYQSTLGTFVTGGLVTQDLYGDRQFPASGFFRFDFILDDGTRISTIINATCDPSLPPTACVSPAAPTAVAQCDGLVEVTFAGTIGQNYKVYVSQVGSPGGWVLVINDTMPASPHTVDVTGLTPGSLYYFQVELDYGAPCNYQASIPVQAVPLPDPEVTITSDKLTVDPNESFTISWTSTNIGGAVCGGCLDGQVGINQGLGCKAGNAAGSQATSQATPGDYTYTITGCNTCGTVVDSVQVTVRNLASCSVTPAFITIENWLTFLCGFWDVTGGTCTPGCMFPTATPGQFPLTTTCTWTGVEHGGCQVDGFWMPLDVTCQFITDRWHLTIVFDGCGGSEDTGWTGEKLFGNSPLGVYTKTGGCATGPATITIT